MADVDQETIVRTQTTLGKVIKKPVLTEKLLRRPPFKFLHDIIVNVIKSTGFMNEVYVSEDMSADNIKDKESKMIFLQKCIDILEIETAEKLDLKTSKVVAGLEADKTNHFLQVLARVALNKKNESATAVQQQQPHPLTGKKTLDDTKLSSSGRQEKLTKKSTDKLKAPIKQKDESSGPKSRLEQEAPAKIDPQDGIPENESSNRKTSADRAEGDSGAPSAGSQDADRVKASARPPTASLSSRKETESTRPTTARAAPPRVSRKQDADDAAALIAAEEENQRLAAPKPIANLIAEGSSVNDGDALFLVGEAVVGDEDEDRKGSAKRRGAGDESETKGSLMKQLMETKKELEGEAGHETEERVTVDLQDVEKLRASLQALSRSANPLGRVLDALQEDIDAMLTEMGTWAAEFSRNTALLHTQKDSIDGEIDGLRARLDGLDQEIADQTEKIAASKAAIQKHEQKLSRVIALVVEKG